MLCHRCKSNFTLLPSQRQIQIARLLALGKRRKEIGAELGITHRTVHSHVEQLMLRLDVHSTAEVVAWAVAAGHVDKKEVLEKE